MGLCGEGAGLEGEEPRADPWFPAREGDLSHPTAGCEGLSLHPSPLLGVGPWSVSLPWGSALSMSPCNIRIGLGSQRSPLPKIPKSHGAGCGEVGADTTMEAQCVH